MILDGNRPFFEEPASIIVGVEVKVDMESANGPPNTMTQQLEDVVRAIDPETGARVLEAVDSTLVALRRDATAIGATPELAEMVRRIDAYRGHVRRALEDILDQA